MHISIIIPGFNEEKRLQRNHPLLLKKLENLGNLSFEIIFVLDGCTDNTEKILKKYIDNSNSKHHLNTRIISYPKNMGKGYAIKKGIESASGDYIFFIDMDVPFDFSFIIHALSDFKKNGMDIVIGSRNLAESKDYAQLSITRKIVNKASLFFENWLLGTNYSDLTCGFKGFKNSIGKHLFQNLQTTHWMFDVEILYIAHKEKLKVKELPVILKNDSESHVRVIRDLYRSLIEIHKIRRNI